MNSEVRQIPLTRGKFAVVDAADFDWLNQWKWCLRYHPTKNKWYAERNAAMPERKTLKMHRVIMDAPSGLYVDHEDGDGLNNSRSNLRLATNQQNCCNQVIRKNNTSGFKGVSRHLNRWKAQIQVKGKRTHIGCFDTPQEAALAYDQAAKNNYGEFASLNFPTYEEKSHATQ